MARRSANAWRSGILGLALFALCVPARAQDHVRAPLAPDSGEAIELLADEVVGDQLSPADVPGAIVVVIRDGKPLLIKGYGLAEIESGRKVSGETTLFRIASITKVFTATAALQLAERGLLATDADIRDYTDLEIPRVSPARLTIDHLMTHTAGFEDSNSGFFLPSGSAPPPLRETLRRTLPGLVRPPGEKPAYSNHGAILLGHIIETVSGEPYPDYLDNHIFHPLGMTRSSALEPLPADLAASSAVGYTFAEDRFVPQAFEVTNAGPAGAISATGSDMAKFMIAQLQPENASGVRLLEPGTMDLMQGCRFAITPGAPCMGYGFYHLQVAGTDIIAHNGATGLFRSNMMLAPSKGVGVFVAFNAAGADALMDAAPRALMKALITASDQPAAAPEMLRTATEARASDYGGDYRTASRPSHGWQKISGIDTLRVSPDPSSGDQVLVDAVQWRILNGDIIIPAAATDLDRRLFFIRGSNGKVIGLSPGGPIYLDRVSVFTTTRFATGTAFAFMASLILFCGMMLRKKSPARQSDAIRNASLTLALAAFPLVCGAGFLGYLALYARSVGFSPPIEAHAAVMSFNCAAALAAVGSLSLFAAARKAHWTIADGIAAAGYVLSFILALSLLIYWNLVGIAR